MEPISPRRWGAGFRIDRDADARAWWRDNLTNQKGIYCWYDSREQLTYVGKSEKNLFGEIEKRLAKAKLRGPHWRTDMEKTTTLVQGDVARMLSVYLFSEEAIPNVEALLIRSAMNGVLNRRLENFG